MSGSGNSQIATLVERQTRYVMLVKLEGKDSQSVVNALIATLAILIANRLLPETQLAGWLQGLQNTGDLERYLFWGAWVMAMLHAFVRSAPMAQGRISLAWRDQCWAVATMAVTAVLLNSVPTGDNLVKTLGERYWPVAGVDPFLLASAAAAMLAARKLKARSEATAQAQRAEAVHT